MPMLSWVIKKRHSRVREKITQEEQERKKESAWMGGQRERSMNGEKDG